MKLLRDAGNAPVQALSPFNTQVVSFNASPQATSVYTANVVVRLACTEDCHIEISATADGDITTSSMYLPSGSVEYFAVYQNNKVAVIQSTTGGSLFITEMI